MQVQSNPSRKLMIALLLLGLLSASCGLSKKSESPTSNRPACVSLPSYSGVIYQVMNMSPDWVPVDRAGEELEYQWITKDQQSDNTLTSILSPEGCVCATKAQSHQMANFNQSKLGGQILGAAVAPVSDLNYTADWLEPKILKSCVPSLILRKPYEDQKTFDDGTTWKFTCTKMSGIGEAMYTLTIITPACKNVFE